MRLAKPPSLNKHQHVLTPQCFPTIYLFFLPSDEHFSLIISNLFKQVILNEDRYVPSAGNSTYRLFTFYFSITLYSVAPAEMLSEFTELIRS